MSRKSYERLVTFVLNSLMLVFGCLLGGFYAIGHLYSTMPIIHDVSVDRAIEEIPDVISNAELHRIAEDTYQIEVPYSDLPETVGEVTRQYAVGNGTLTATMGVSQGISGVETWYNLPMDKVVQSMRIKGYSEEEYPYGVRDDGVKTLGDYVIVAADFNKHPKGSIVETTLGQGIVCDTGDFTKNSDVEIDIATTW